MEKLDSLYEPCAIFKMKLYSSQVICLTLNQKRAVLSTSEVPISDKNTFEYFLNCQGMH